MPRAPRLAVALLAALTACTVSRVPPAVRPLPAPLPLAVAVCGPTDSLLAAPFGADGVLFARVVAADGTARPDLVARLRTGAPEVRYDRTSVGLFIWTLAIVPAASREVVALTVELRRPAAGADPCAASDAPSLALAATARARSLSGWIPQLALRPTPWWQDVSADRAAQRRSLAGHARAEVARLVAARRDEIVALAGGG